MDPAPDDAQKKPDPPPNEMGTYAQQFQHQPVAARVPERNTRGSFTSGVLVLDSPNEFVLDFLQGLTRPHQIVARVVVVPAIMDQIVTASADNLEKYISAFGAPPSLPKPPQKRPTIAEIYENFKLADDMLSGSYANSVMVGHSASEFFFDFITGFYPTAAVSSRIITTAHHMPRIVDTLKMALQQYRNRYQQPPQPPQPPP
jgi:hypothetical protein